MRYYYDSPIGAMYIYPHNGKYNLEIRGDVCGTYDSAVAAADDVFCHATGCYDWDKLQVNDMSTDIHEWKRD